ncbi:mannan-binding lectin serine protease 1-like [Ptychodera flava]|uniref:mannan-binding lectin serine protease 1-like n=1 Tax=Ptychodera flava TaxID=63121 RepID=UPI00396A662A
MPYHHKTRRVYSWIIVLACFCMLNSCEGQSGGDLYRINDDEDDDDSCGGTRSVRELPGQITTPNYPDAYPDNEDCNWLLVATPGDHVTITFDDFDVEQEDDCQYDNVMIFDGPDKSFDLIGSFCGNTIPEDIVSTNRHLYITFHSDLSENGRGFSLIYTIDDNDAGDSEEIHPEEEPESNERENAECRYLFTEQEGSIQSPNYPYSYPSNADCVYIISVDDAATIEISFLDLETEGYGCSFDYVVVKDGNNQDADTIDTYCGNGIPDPITSTGNVLYIHFVSDGSDNRRGFHLDYKAKGIDQPVAEQLYFTESPQNLTVDIGQSVTQRCRANNDDVVITWFKDGISLNQGVNDGIYILEDGLFIIPEISDQHLDKYKCRIQTRRGSFIETTVSLHTADSLIAGEVFQVVPSDATINEEDIHAFHCEVAPGLGYTVAWEKDGNPIDFDHRIYQIQGNDLYVSMALPSHGGQYTCVAIGNNDERIATASARLTIVPKKTVAEVCGKVMVGNDTTEDATPAEDNFRIVDGKTSVKGTAPWMARLWNVYDRRHFCGGSVLNDYWIVTAAHCFRNLAGPPEQLVEIRLGDYDDLQPDPEERIHPIAEVIPYPDFDGSNFDGDIALVRLVTKIQFTDYICPICLPSKLVAQAMLKRNQVGRVLGWGQISEGGRYPRYLNEVNVPVRRKPECVESAQPYEMTSNMFCAGYRGALTGDACKGDSGGPFVQQRNSTWYLVGIVSWGEGCARENEFGFYTKVYKYYAWIDDVLNQ